MKSIHLLLLLGTFCMFIVPSFQYGTIFTDYLSTPVNFTDITETYISGIKSKTAYANTATVDTITATNPDGFYVNSPGPLNAEAGENLDLTSAQSVVFGTADSSSTSLTSGGALNIQNDRTDVDVDDLTLSTGKTLSLESEGPLNIQGNNIDVATDGNGFVSGRDITVDSATDTEVRADANILLNSTYHSSFITQNGDISILAEDETTFDSNFINVEASFGVDIRSGGEVSIQAFAILEMQAAQFAQVQAQKDVNIYVKNGDFDINAAATAAIAADSDLTFTANNQFEIYSFGDSESIIQFNARSGHTGFSSNSLTIGTFVDSYDVDLIASGNMKAFSDNVAFTANNYISTIAGEDLDVIATGAININSLDLDVSSYGDSSIESIEGSVTFDTLENFNTQARDTYLETSGDILISSREASFLQGAPAILSRSEPSNLLIQTQLISTTAVTTQFDTIGDFILSTPKLAVTAATVDIRSSAGPHNVFFNIQSDFDISATDDIKYLASTVNINPKTEYTTLSDTLNFVSEDSSQNIFRSGTDAYINAPTSTFSSNGDTTIEAEFDEVNMIMSDNFIQNSYNNYLQTLGDINISSNQTIAIGANEYINLESAFNSTFDARATFVRADQTGSMFGEDITADATVANFKAGDTLYFTANLPTNSLDMTSKNVTFVGTTVFESGRNLQITANDNSSFTGSKLVIEGYDYNNFNAPSVLVESNGHITISSDGALDLTSGTLDLNQDLHTRYAGDQEDSTLYLSAINAISYTSTSIYSEQTDKYSVTSTTTELSSKQDTTFTAQNLLSLESENTIQIVSTKATLSGNEVRFESLLNDLHSTGSLTIASTVNDGIIKAGTDNAFTSTGLLKSHSVGSSLFDGGNLELDGDTLDYQADLAYFYSDDQITFNVQNGINLQSAQLDFVLPLDGSLFLEGTETSILSTSAAQFNFISSGATTLTAEGTIDYDASGFTEFDSVTTQITATDFTLKGNTVGSAVTLFAHEGEVNFEGSSYSLTAATNSFLASRDVNIKGKVLFTSNRSDPSTTVRANSVQNLNTTAALAILAETVHEDSHIVFHALAGNIHTSGDSIFINTEGLQTINGGYGVSTFSSADTDFFVTGNHDLQTATGTSFDAGRTWSLSVVGQTYIESGLDISFQNILNSVHTAPFTVFNITADRMTVSTSQEGPLHITSDSSLQFLTDTSQSWEVTHSALTQSTTTQYTSTAGNINTLTSSGRVLSEFSTFVGSAGVNITFNSGHDSTFAAGSTTFSAGTDVLTKSVDGKIVFTNGDAANFVAGGQISIDSEGPRTVPRDGVFFGGNNIYMEATGTNSVIYLYARRSVTFGEFTRPAVTFNAGGSATQNGWVLTSDGKISLDAGTEANFNSADQFTLTTSQASIFTSGAAMNLESTGTLTGSADNIQISSLIGNVHFHSKLDSNWYTPSQLSATSTTGFIEFTTLGSATFEADGNFKESANSLTYSFDSSYTSTSSSTSFDGHSYFDITTRLGSDGSIVFLGGNSVFSSVGNFDINTYGDDAKLELNALGDLTIRTPKTGAIKFTSYEEIDIVATDITEFADEKYSVSANSNIGEDPSKGSIQYYAIGSDSIFSQDTIDYTSAMDVSILAGSLEVSSTGDFLASSNYDQEWNIGTSSAQSFNSLFDVTRAINFKNTVGGGGDVNFITSGNGDLTYFHSTNGDIIENIGNNQIGEVSKGFRIATSGSDFKDAFGIRFQTEGLANLEVFSSASAVFNGHKNTKFDASEDLNVYGGIGVSMVAQGVNLDNYGVLFVASTGNVEFKTEQSPISFVGNHIDIIGNGTSSNQGVIKVIANGIDKDAEYGIRMQFDAAVAAFGSIDGDINVTAKESIEIGLNFQGAHALFGYQRNDAEALANIFQYDPFYPYIPSNHLNIPLQSETTVVATGVGADIVIDTQVTEDGVGQFIAYAGTLEEAYMSQTNAPSQLQLIAHGNGDVMGDITFRQEGGLSFKGVDLNEYLDTLNPLTTPPIQSNIIFLANDETSDIVVKTSKEAIFSDIDHISTELTLDAENKLQIRSIGRNGDSNVQFDSDRKIYVQTTGPSQGPGTELPGIELRAYESLIEVDAGDYGDVIHHALRNMYLEADNGFEFSTLGQIVFDTENIFLRSSAGGVSFRHRNSYFNVDGDVVISTFSVETSPELTNYLGNNVKIESDLIAFSSNTGTFEVDAIGGDIYFNFEDQSLITAATSINVFGYMSIPMTDELIVNGQTCDAPTSSTVQRMVIARSPPYDIYDLLKLGVSPNSYAAPQYAFYTGDIYQGLGLRLCTCGARDRATYSSNYRWACMNFSQFTF